MTWCQNCQDERPISRKIGGDIDRCATCGSVIESKQLKEIREQIQKQNKEDLYQIETEFELFER